jgi:hypothetical protein
MTPGEPYEAIGRSWQAVGDSGVVAGPDRKRLGGAEAGSKTMRAARSVAPSSERREVLESGVLRDLAGRGSDNVRSDRLQLDGAVRLGV